MSPMAAPPFLPPSLGFTSHCCSSLSPEPVVHPPGGIPRCALGPQAPCECVIWFSELQLPNPEHLLGPSPRTVCVLPVWVCVLDWGMEPGDSLGALPASSAVGLQGAGWVGRTGVEPP